MKDESEDDYLVFRPVDQSFDILPKLVVMTVEEYATSHTLRSTCKSLYTTIISLIHGHGQMCEEAGDELR